MVAGDGKTQLDGLFSRMNKVLCTAMDAGMSYQNTDQILVMLGYHRAGVMSISFVGSSHVAHLVCSAG